MSNTDSLDTRENWTRAAREMHVMEFIDLKNSINTDLFPIPVNDTLLRISAGSNQCRKSPRKR